MGSTPPPPSLSKSDKTIDKSSIGKYIIFYLKNHREGLTYFKGFSVPVGKIESRSNRETVNGSYRFICQNYPVSKQTKTKTK